MDGDDLKTGKLRKVQGARQHLFLSFEHRLLISFVSGLFSCRWRRQRWRMVERGEWCCSMRECLFFPVLVTAFCFSFTLLYLWGEGRNDYNNFDWYSFTNLDFWFLWSIFVLVLVAVSFSYVLLLVLMAMFLVSEGHQLYLHWCHKIGTTFILVFSIVTLVVISLMWKVQWKTVILSMQFTAPFMHLVALLFMVLLSWPVAMYTFRLDQKVLKVLVLVPFLALLLFLFFIPLGMYSPCIREKGTLGPKPALIAHRGAPMVGPENTMMSFEDAIAFFCDGLETDVRISFDGIPFLMHDVTLKRTTNIREVQPENASLNAAMFTWSELMKLDAGDWFYKNQPYYHIPDIDYSGRKYADTQRIVRLREFLELADEYNQTVIFDLSRPPPQHPHRDKWIRTILNEILTESAIRHDLVFWLENIERAYVRATAPGFQQTFNRKASLDVLKREEIVMLNVDYREISAKDIRMYAQNNITSNFYVVNEPWLFSLAWCAGAHSVTTNAVHILSEMKKPAFLMTPWQYRLMWILTDVFSGILITLVFFFHWRREKRISPFTGDSTKTRGSGAYHAFRKGLETRQGMPTVA